MGESIRTSFLLKSANTENVKEKGVILFKDFYCASQEIIPFSDQEEQTTSKLLKQIQNHIKRKPILHLAFGTEGVTDGYITRSIPKNIRKKFYEKAVIVLEESKNQLSLDRQRILEQKPKNIIFIARSGEITLENLKKLQNIFKSRTGIIIGGGPHDPADSVYKPVIKTLEKTLEQDPTPIGGICLGHQLISLLMGASKRVEVTEKWYEKGPTVEKTTPEGQKHEVVKRFGLNYVTVMAHAYSIIFPQAQTYYQILSKNLATGEPVTIGYNEKGILALTTQAHPEWGIGIRAYEASVEGPIDIEIQGQRVRILEPGQKTHADIVACAQSMARNFHQLSQKLREFSLQSIKDVLHPQRIQARALGKDFFGPLIMMMTKSKATKIS